MNDREELIARYLLGELRAYGLVAYDNGTYVHEEATHDYLVELKVHSLSKSIRLSED